MATIDNSKLSKEINQKYLIKDNTFSYTPKDDWKDRIKTEVGDSKQPVFHPQAKIHRWDEVNFSARLVHTETNPTLETEGDKIKWKGDKVEAHFYDKPVNQELPEGGYEFEVVLLEKPKTNIVEFTLNTKCLDFHRQPPLTEEWKVGQLLRDGEITEVTETQVKIGEKVVIERPENIVNSYVIYASEEKINYVGGKEYKTGQVGIIYRIWAKDANGVKVWCDTKIENGLLKIFLDKDFLDKAVYPVIIDPTFGYTTSPSTEYASSANALYVSYPNTAISENATVSKLSAYIKETYSGTTNIKGVLIQSGSPNTLVSNGVSGATSVSTGGLKALVETNYSTSPSLVSGTYYYLGFVVKTNGYGCYYNTVSGYRMDWFENSYTTPTAGSFVPTDLYDGYVLGIYVTYTTGGTDVTVTPSVLSSVFSIQSPTITAIRQSNISVNTQTTTFSLPASTISLNLIIQPGVLTASFTAQAPNVTAIRNITITPTVLSGSFSLQSTIVNLGAILPISVLSLTASIQAPTITLTSNATIPVSVLSSAFILNSPTITVIINKTILPDVLVANLSIQNPTVVTIRNIIINPTVETATFSIITPVFIAIQNVSISPDTLSLTFSLQSPIVTAVINATITPNSLSPVFTLNEPTILAIQNTTILPAILTATLTSPTVTILTTRYVTVNPTVLTASFSIQNVTITNTINIELPISVLTATFSLISPTVDIAVYVIYDTDEYEYDSGFINYDGRVVGIKVSPTVLSATFSIQQPTVDEGLISVIIQPAVFTNTFSIPAPVISAIRNISISPITFTSTFSIPAFIVTGGATLPIGVLTANFSIQNVLITNTINVEVSVNVFNLSFSLPNSTIYASRYAIIEIGVLTGVFNIISPTITAIRNVTIVPDPLTGIFTILLPLIHESSGIWDLETRSNPADWDEEARSADGIWTEETRNDAVWTEE